MDYGRDFLKFTLQLKRRSLSLRHEILTKLIPSKYSTQHVQMFTICCDKFQIPILKFHVKLWNKFVVVFVTHFFWFSYLFFMYQTCCSHNCDNASLLHCNSSDQRRYWNKKHVKIVFCTTKHYATYPFILFNDIRNISAAPQNELYDFGT